MNCRDFIIEFEERSALSEIAAKHLDGCADCRKTSNIQTRVWQGIEAFEMVDAPKDFDFRVKARIANANPRDFHPQFFPVLRYVLGLSVVGLILAFVVFNGFYSPDEKSVPTVAEKSSQPPIQKENFAPKSSQPEQIISDEAVLPTSNDKNLIAAVSKPKITKIDDKRELKTVANENHFVAVKATKISQPKTATDNQENSGGSHVLAVSTPEIHTPAGIPNETQTTENSPNIKNTSSTTAEQILSLLGIETSLVNGTRQVKTIKPNSVAERSGVEVGDFVEAVDGEKLTNEPIQAKTFEGKKLTIRRGAEIKEILLHN